MQPVSDGCATCTNWRMTLPQSPSHIRVLQKALLRAAPLMRQIPECRCTGWRRPGCMLELSSGFTPL